MRIQLVIDLGYGDAGKGHVVDWLSSTALSSTLVFRFGGGHQVGHTVVTPEARHVFSNFTAGTLRGLEGFWGSKTVIFPSAMLIEGLALEKYRPFNYIHPLAIVCTPYDIAYNRHTEKKQGHGSCGLGFGATVERGLDDNVLYAKDLAYPWVLSTKLKQIESYYLEKSQSDPAFYDEICSLNLELFKADCESIKAYMKVSSFQNLRALADLNLLIFEGHQGIMLDKRHGFSPHTTYSSTGSRGFFESLRADFPSDIVNSIDKIEIYYLCRAYQTRHGLGPLSYEGKVELVGIEDETNKTNPWQGQLRYGELDTDLLCYALQSDGADYDQGLGETAFAPDIKIEKSLVVTCLDQRPNFTFPWEIFKSRFGLTHFYESRGPKAEDISELL